MVEEQFVTHKMSTVSITIAIEVIVRWVYIFPEFISR